MSRVSHLNRDQIGASPVYLFEGGMTRDHSTRHSEQLTNKIRLSSLFASNILVHSGNIFEEPALFEALKTDPGLLEKGRIVPVLRGKTATLEEYGANWRTKFERRDPADPVYYQSRRITPSDISAIEERISYFQEAKYKVLMMPPSDREIFQSNFLASVNRILDAETALDDEVKKAIRQRAAASSSPLGRIRQEVLRPYWSEKGTAKIVRRVARRINLAFFACGAGELNTWFSMNGPAFHDLKNMPAGRGVDVSELIELSVSRALQISENQLLKIGPDDFASIVTSAGARKFRQEVEKTIAGLSQEFGHGGEAQDLASTRLAMQQELDENFCDTFATSFAKAMRERRKIERRGVKWGIQGTLVTFGVATDYFTDKLHAPFPVSSAVGLGLSVATGRYVTPRVAPVIMLQEKLSAAIDRSRAAT